MNTCGQPKTIVREWSFSNYLIKGICDIVQVSNIGYKSVTITPEYKHTLINWFGFSSCVFSSESWNNNKDDICQL